MLSGAASASLARPRGYSPCESVRTAIRVSAADTLAQPLSRQPGCSTWAQAPAEARERTWPPFRRDLGSQTRRSGIRPGPRSARHSPRQCEPSSHEPPTPELAGAVRLSGLRRARIAADADGRVAFTLSGGTIVVIAVGDVWRSPEGAAAHPHGYSRPGLATGAADALRAQNRRESRNYRLPPHALNQRVAVSCLIERPARVDSSEARGALACWARLSSSVVPLRRSGCRTP